MSKKPYRKKDHLRVARTPPLAHAQDLPVRIVRALEVANAPMTTEEIATRLRLRRGARDALAPALEALLRSGTLVRNRAGAVLVARRISVVAGRVTGHPDGHGFLEPDGGGEQIYLPGAEMREVMHGDRASVRITGRDPRGRPAGVVVEVLERAQRRIVGRLRDEHGVFVLVPEDRRIAQNILVPPAERGRARVGDVVTVDLLAQPSRVAQPVGRVLEVLGKYADPGMEIEIALRKFDLPFQFSPAAEAAARALPESIRAEDREGRRDLCNLPFVTIDGENAKDFDDAVHAAREGRGYRLWVAIADVDHYVGHGSALDAEARTRGTSVYFPRRVIPMLPERLSNGLCSLNPDVERLAMVCELAVDADGETGPFRFYPAVFRSRARLTYTEVWSMLDGGAPNRGREEVYPHLVTLYALYRRLVEARRRRGAIDFETIETRMEFDVHGKIERILPETRNDAHRLIEECMLAANVCAGNFLTAHGHPALYRVHDVPAEDRVAALREFLAETGLRLPGGAVPKPQDYAQLLEKIRKRADFPLLQTLLLRSLKQALYSPDNTGHFGLAFESYVHFTSPIRRYPDLLIHRAIKAVLGSRRYEAGDWSELGRHCSETERRADEASREVEAWLKCYHMKEQVGGVFAGVVTGVVPFGLFVTLDDYFVDGLVHISELGRDYFQYDGVRHTLLGERTGKRFRLADRLKVKLVRVDLEARKMDFVPA